jgi:hypothetical protein
MIAERTLSPTDLFDGDAFPPLGTPTLQDRPAGFLAHARSETMDLVVFSLVRLICTLWHNLSDS